MNDTSDAYRIANACEILPERLYFVAVSKHPQSDADSHFFTVDRKYRYASFCDDFGPLNLGATYRFSQFLISKLEDEEHQGKKIYICTGTSTRIRANVAALIGAFSILYLNKTAEEAYEPFRLYDNASLFKGFRDASWAVPSLTLKLLDVLRGVHQAMVNGFLDFSNFDVDEYERMEKIEYGDLNWIVPGKFIAFAGPHQKQHDDNGYLHLAPEFYHDYFHKNNVTDVVRLNIKKYDASQFTDAGINHWDLFYQDGTNPPTHIFKKFMSICDDAKGAVAVHCKAGLGRTGTLIGCFMMKEYGLRALEAIAWMRIARPGCVIGPQQRYMLAYDQELQRANIGVNERKSEVHRPSWAVQDITRFGCVSACPTTPLKQNTDAIKISGTASRSLAADFDDVAPREPTQALPTMIGQDQATQGDLLTQAKARSQHAASNESKPRSLASSCSDETQFVSEPVF